MANKEEIRARLEANKAARELSRAASDARAIADANNRMENCREQLEECVKKHGAIAACANDMTPEIQQQMLLRLYDTSHNDAEAVKGRTRAAQAAKLRQKLVRQCLEKLETAISNHDKERADELVDCLLSLDKFVFDGTPKYLHQAVATGDENLVEKLLAVSNVALCDENSNTALHIAITHSHFDIARMILDKGGFVYVDNKERESQFQVFKRKQFKIKFFIESEFTYDALSKSNYGLWFHIIQLHDIPDIESRVAHYMSKFNILGYARDEHGRIAVNVATQVNRVAIQSEYLWHGRYRILESRPQHVSKTCLVYRGVDEEDLNEIGDPKPIALKLMVHKTHFHKELTARQHDFDSGFIMDISNHFPDSSESSYASMPEVCGFDIENVIRMTKLQAEKLYCVALPYAERNMFVAMKQERFAGSNMDEVAHVFSQIVKCVEHMHSFGLIHGDLKPLNIVRVGAHWKLIDLDATSKIGVEVHLSKFSSAYIPPESIFIDPDSGMASVKKPRKIATTEAELIDMKYESRDKYARVADPSFDVWSLGCILYQLCNEEVRPLFFAGQDDNLNINSKGENSLYALGCWTTELKNKKMKKITDPVARNLISQMLMKDPKDRPTVSRVLSHPFISKKKISRFVGEEAEYDVFISYRVNSDCHHAEQLYNGLTKRGLKVWWDKVSLEPGVPWKEGFCDGLSNAKTFVCLLSRNAINHSENFNQNFGMLSEDSDVDNMYLEIRLATEFVALGLIDRIFPVMIGDSEDDYVTYMDNFFRVDSSTYNSPCAPYLPQECPKLVEDEVLVEMERQAMGIPLRIGPTVAEIMHDIFNYQGVFITGERNKAFDNVECKIETMLGAIYADAIKVDTEQCESDDVKSMHTSNVPSSASSRIVAVHRANIEEKEQIIESLQEEIDKLKAQLKAPSE